MMGGMVPYQDPYMGGHYMPQQMFMDQLALRGPGLGFMNPR